jgi:predicted metal-dependent peptidase
MGGFPYLMDPKYIGWSTEEIYDDLLQNAEEIPMDGYVLSADVMPCDEKQANEAVSNVVAAVMTARLSNAAGALPGEVEVVLDQFLNPKLPWERLLFNYMNELTDTERSYARPSRRYQDILMPGNTGRNGLDHLVYYLDVSGSVSDEEIALFNTEFKSVKEALEPERMTMVTFDTEIRNSYVFEKDQAFKKLVTSGRGGTCLKPVFEHMKKTAPTAAVIFSDMAVSIPPNPGIPIIWICVNSPDVTVPYGKLVHIST